MKRPLTASIALALASALTSNITAQPGPETLRYMIVVTGNELLEGAYADSHTLYLTRLLQPRGWRCIGSLSVGDDRNDLLQALRFATSNAPIVLVTGGLGPTPNDITRQTIAKFTNIELREDPAVLRAMSKRLNQPEASLPENLRQQCLIPVNGHHLENPNGTAVGLVFHTFSHHIVALPGPPDELRPLARDQLVPYLHQQFGDKPPGNSLTVRFAGIRQSFIVQEIKQHLQLPPTTRISSDFDGSRVDFTFTLDDRRPQDPLELTLLRAQLHDLFIDHIYGLHIDGKDILSLEQQTAQALSQTGANVVLADAGTDGILASGLCATTNANPVLAGSYAAQTEDRVAHLLGIPSTTWTNWKPGAERAKGLALTAAAQTGTGWAVGIGEIAPPVNETNYVWVAIKSPKAAWTLKQIGLPAWDQRQAHSLATDILYSLRQQILSPHSDH